MIARHAERGLWGAATLFFLAGASSLRATASGGASVAPAPLGAAPALPSADSLTDALDEIIGGNLFRPERAAFDGAQAPPLATAMRPMAAPRPPLTLRGMVGGPPWDILIDGIPGHDGATVLRVGQAVDGYRVRAVRRDTVIVSGPDTTWKLTLRRQ